MGVTGFCRGTRIVSKSSLEEAAESSPGRKPGVERKQMFSPEGAAQFILRIGFSVAPSGLSNFVILTPGSRPGLFSAAPSGLE